MDKFNSISSNMVKYIIEEDKNSAFASLNFNPGVRWAKFVLTDDKPNGNNFRIPEEEFDNLIKTGVHMPLKVASGKISDGHEGASPIGVITHLKKVKNSIIGLAALWEKERPEDVDMIRKKYENNEPLELSWEIEYSDEKEEENEVKSLFGTRLRAVTLVGIPAYGGRTPITAFASDNNKQEDSKLDELKELKEKLATANQEIEKLINNNKELKDKLEAQKEQASTDKEELEKLREYKKEIEDMEARIEKLKAIKTKFEDAGLGKSDEYFTENEDKLLEMDETALEFMIQELVAFSEKITKGDNDKEEDSSKLPRLLNTDAKVEIKDLVNHLRELNRKK